ncbi:unnamed protein product [Clavelina lepadiformis]|uniref:Inositol-tetrakisphosphate 1-kinase n=1 Tax=Clavelina lepadiformis TaxID=159417 RepID=A0ABP0GR88_CLALP
MRVDLQSERRIELVEINLNESLDDQGPFHVIVHKLTDLMIDEMDGNEKAAKYLSHFQCYLERNPGTVLVDPLHSIRRLLNRYETYKLISETKLCKQDHVIHVPSFALILSRNKEEILAQMRDANVHFPIMCKKNIAHGSESHKMSIIFNEHGLDNVDPPCVAQTFVDHNAMLYKIFVIANKYQMVERPSLINFSRPEWNDHSTIFFNSHDISSADSLRSELTTLGKGEDHCGKIDSEIVHRLTQQLHQEVQMSMYGIDIIVCPKTLKHYIIDVNVFPSYDGVDGYHAMLADHIASTIDRQSTSVDLLNIKKGERRLFNGIHAKVNDPL